MDLTLFSLRSQTGSTKALVSSEGGNINSFSVNGGAIFYERRKVGDKICGGCHFCAPWFGPSGMGPQHGYLRNLLGGGERVEGFDDPTVSLGFTGPITEKYQWPLNYSVRAEIYTASLSLELCIALSMHCESHYRAPVLPGLHPYFAGKASVADIVVNGMHLSCVSEPRFFPLDGAKEVSIRLPNKEIIMSLGQAFGKDAGVILWTGDPERHFCVEPLIQRPDMFNTSAGRFLERGECLGLSVMFTRIV